MTTEVVAAIDVGGTRIKSGLLTRDAELLFATATATPSSQGAVRGAVNDEASRLIGEATERGFDVVGIGLAVPGIIDEAAGVAVSSMIIGWRNVAFKQALSDLTGLPVGFGHDVRAAAAAEASIGAAADAKHFLYLSIGTGLGATMVLDGKPYLGPRGLSGEFAHIVVADEPKCRCGNRGCLEMIASAAAIHASYERAAGSPIGLPELMRRLDQGEDLANAVWTTATGLLGRALAAYVEMMDPEVVVVGGGLIEAGGRLLEPLAREAVGRVSRSIPPIVAARFGSQSGLVGAGLLGWVARSTAESGS